MVSVCVKHCPAVTKFLATLFYCRFKLFDTELVFSNYLRSHRNSSPICITLQKQSRRQLLKICRDFFFPLNLSQGSPRLGLLGFCTKAVNNRKSASRTCTQFFIIFCFRVNKLHTHCIYFNCKNKNK